MNKAHFVFIATQLEHEKRDLQWYANARITSFCSIDSIAHNKDAFICIFLLTTILILRLCQYRLYYSYFTIFFYEIVRSIKRRW